MGWRTFVALGDSFTEGLDDPDPGGPGYRGWADLVAQWLATTAEPTGPSASTCSTGRSDPPASRNESAERGAVRYANLAVRGRLLADVIEQQVPVAVAMRPALVSFAAGGNDALRRNFDADHLMTRLAAVVKDLRGVGADVLLFRCADFSARLPARRLLRPRIELFNAAVSAVGERYGARVVDLWGDDGFTDSRLWSPDRLHLSPAGHRRVAARVAETLDQVPDPTWLDPDADARSQAPAAWLSARTADARWARQHLVPWLGRRLRGRSSGDTVHPKRPSLEPV